ncbi:MAG: MGH1-like glycoside hydrolase domain-containing protein [Pleomorphochaeta sp.]
MIKELVPAIHFYDQDFVDMYNRTWVWINEQWNKGTDKNGFVGDYLAYPEQKTFNQFEACMSALFLIYSNQKYSPFALLDYFYSKQEEDGAIRSDYSIEDGSPVKIPNNPLGLAPCLFAYVEFTFYHKIGNKKRLKEVVPKLEKYFEWLDNNFKAENGLYSVPLTACVSGNIPRSNCYYPIDFNAQLAMNALYMSAIGDVLNDKELSFKYKKMYFGLKTRINTHMWDEESQFYYDLNIKGKKIGEKFIGAYWTLLAEIPNDERASFLIEKLHDSNEFGTDNPFPGLPVSSPNFSESGNGWCGGVIPINTFMVVKGLIKYNEFVFARECAIRHLYFILDTFHPDADKVDDIWEGYLPNKEGKSTTDEIADFPRKRFLPMNGLITIALMIENIIGMDISLPRKTVDWTMTSREAMGIENLSLKRNMITILSNKNARGWEVRLESEKLYYFTIEIIDEDKKKTLPIPSGKCSMLVDKL